MNTSVVSLWLLPAAGALAAAAGAVGASADVPVRRVDVYVAGQRGYHTYRIPALAVTKGGAVLAFCEARKFSPRDQGKIDLAVRRSDDGGRTWGPLRIVHAEEGDTTTGNPCPIVDRADGRIHLVFCRNNRRVFYTFSDDDGRRFAAPREITPAAKQFDFPVKRMGTGPGRGLQLGSGRLVVPIWLHGGDRPGQDAPRRAGVLLSDDHGRTWYAGGLAADGSNESAAVQLDDGRILLNSRNYSPTAGRRLVAVSRDGGKTFRQARTDETLIEPLCQASMLHVPAGLAGPRSCVLFCNPAHRAPTGRFHGELRRDLTLRASFDDGRTWPVRFLLEPKRSAYSDLAVLPDATLLVLYERGERTYRERITLARLPLKRLLEAGTSERKTAP